MPNKTMNKIQICYNNVNTNAHKGKYRHTVMNVNSERTLSQVKPHSVKECSSTTLSHRCSTTTIILLITGKGRIEQSVTI